MQTARTQKSLGICQGSLASSCWQQGLRSAWASAKGSQLLHADSKDSQKPGHLPRVLSYLMQIAKTKMSLVICQEFLVSSCWQQGLDQAGHQLSLLSFFMATARTQIRLGRCPGISEFLLEAQQILLFFVTHWLHSFMVHKYSVIIRWGAMLGPNRENTSILH